MSTGGLTFKERVHRLSRGFYGREMWKIFVRTAPFALHPVLFRLGILRPGN